MGEEANLLSPFRIRSVEARNRIAISPMCTYSAVDGMPDDFHLVHLGRYAIGGAGIVFAEATAVCAEGRISHGDTGLYDDGQIEPWARIADFMARNGAVPAMQLSHAGRKASAHTAWDGFGPLETSYGAEAAWPTVAPSAVAAEGWPSPGEMTVDEIRRSVADWGAAAQRAVKAGFRIVEIHGAHGYLVHQFLAPQSNHRNDAYGGSFEGRVRYALEVAKAVRDGIGPDVALLFRMSVVDGSGSGAWTIDDSVRLARLLAEAGVDMIDCSSGGMTGPTPTRAVPRGYGFQVPLAATIRRETGLPVMAVGLIVDPNHADRIVRSGDADIVAIAREALLDPNWASRANAALSGGYADWPRQYGLWLDKRTGTLASIDRRDRASG